MKKAILAILALSAIVLSCKKSGSGGGTTADPYMSTTANSTWKYDVITNPGTAGSTSIVDTVTATSTDTTINTTGTARTYRILKHTNGGTSDYYNRSGNDYYRYQNLAGLNAKVENIYLKENAAVGTSWNQNVNLLYMSITVPLTITNSIAGTGLTKVVNGVTYTDVIDVKTDLSSSALPAGSITSDIHSYYARKVGLIQGDYKVVVPAATININTQTLLKTADIK